VSRGRVVIPQRVRIYLGCEGQSEQSYGRRLSEIADARGLHLYFDNDVLQPGGGDPLALVELAVRRIEQRKRLRGDFRHRALLLDGDKLGQAPGRDGRIAALVRENRLYLIWQRPCHEGFLLRHFAGQASREPQSAELAIRELKKLWPEYAKPMAAVRMAEHIHGEAIERVCVCEPEFRAFLRLLGF